MNTLRTSLTTALCVLITASAWAGTIRVEKGGTYPTIQSGVNAAVSGDTILIDAGTYKENVVVQTKELAIQPAKAGEKGLVTIDGKGSTPLTFAFGSDHSKATDLHVRTTGNYGIVVAGLSRGGQPAKVRYPGFDLLHRLVGVRIARCTVGGDAIVAGIKVKKTAGTVISKCEVSGGKSHGIQVEKSINARISRCRVLSVGGEGISVDSEGTTIIENEVTRAGNNGILLGSSYSANSCDVMGNIVEGSGNDGIRLDDNSSACLVQDNELRDNLGNGLSVDSTEDHLIAGNKIVGSGLHGVLVEKSTTLELIENVSKSNSAENYYLDSDSSKVTLLNNRSTHGSAGGFLIDGEKHRLLENSCRTAGDDGLEFLGKDHYVWKNDSMRSGQVKAGGLDLRQKAATGCIFLDNIYDTSDF